MFYSTEFKRNEKQWLVFIILHIKTNFKYIGYTNSPKRTLINFYYKLKRGTHTNKHIQNAYMDDPRLERIYFGVDSEIEAIKLKSMLIQRYAKRGELFNIDKLNNHKDNDPRVDIIVDKVEMDDSVKLPPMDKRRYERFIELRSKPFDTLATPSGLHVLTNTDIHAKSRVVGVYVIYHPKTGKYYVGSTSNLYSRIVAHLSGLRKNNHENSSLNLAFKSDPQIEIICYKTDDREKAFELEQDLMDSNKHNLFNKALDSKNNFHGYIYKGKPMPDWIREKISNSSRIRTDLKRTPINIDGVVYSSVSEASRQLGINKRTLFRRIHSKTHHNYTLHVN